MLYQQTDLHGKMVMGAVARGDLRREMLIEDEVNLVDLGHEIFVWIGGGASSIERASAFNTATAFLKQRALPLTTPVTLIKQGQGERSPIFSRLFAH